MLTNETNFFILLNINEEYDIDFNILESHYLRKQIEIHPDKFINSSKEEKEASEKLSSLINTAYETLKDPIKRAIYMLQLKNISIDNNASPQKLLIKALEYHEEIENCKSIEETKNLYTEIKNIYKNSLEKLRNLFANNILDNLPDAIIEATFYKKLLDQVTEKLDNSSKL